MTPPLPRMLGLACALLLMSGVWGTRVAAAPSSPVGEIVVTPARAVRVARTYPAMDAAVPFGHLVLTLVFDQPMSPDAWSYGPSTEGRAPPCLDRPRLLPDGRTFVLLCSVPKGGAFAVRINAAPGFVSAAGRQAEPYVLRFSTGDDYTGTLHEALAQAGLTDADDPIMEWAAAAKASRP